MNRSYYYQLIGLLMFFAGSLHATTVHESVSLNYPLDLLQATQHQAGFLVLPLSLVVVTLLIWMLISRSRQLVNTNQMLQAKNKKCRNLLKITSKGIWITDSQLKTLEVSQSLGKILGYNKHEIADKNLIDFMDEKNRATLHQLTSRVNSSKQQIHEITLKKKNGKDLHVMVNAPTIKPQADDSQAAVTLVTNNSEPLHVNRVTQEISELKKAQEQLRISASIFSQSQEGIVISDADNRIVDVNPACLRLTGYSREEVIGANPSIFSSQTQPDEFYREMWESLKQTGSWSGELWNRKKSGLFYYQHASIEAIRTESGKVQNYVAVFSDITYLKDHESALKSIAHHDALTDLPNRLLLRDRMQQALTQANRNQTRVAVCYLDLDGFKEINDIHSHKHGDMVLIEVARRLREAVRDGDTVAHLGGDEFALLLPNLKKNDELEQLLEHILHNIARPCKAVKTAISISASIGVSIYPMDADEADTLLRHADHAMYAAKQQGKNRFKFFSYHDEQKKITTHAQRQEIRDALAQDQMYLVYQPKVNMRTGKVIGAEALIRWQHPLKGLISPADFLPAIEDHNLIIELGQWVLHNAMNQLRSWQNEGLELSVSVNIAARQLQHADFAPQLGKLLEEFSDISPAHLELEILESTALEDISHISHIMQECIKLGVQFALDDFGTGYSSLTYLRRLPAAVLKIDQSFVRDLLDNPEDLAITEGILGLAHAFQRTPIAEGVETFQQGSMLLNLGCELAQGYGIARPMRADQLAGWIDDFQTSSPWANKAGPNQSNKEASILVMAVKHHRMVGRVLNAIEQGSIDLFPAHRIDHHTCDFGQWLEGEGAKRYAHLAEFRRMESSHKRVHELMAETLKAFDENDEQSLENIFGQLKEARNDVLDSLHELRNSALNLS